MQLRNDPIFHRRELARYFVELLQSPEASSGIFLAAPRRTGKTTFIKADLVPLLQAEGALVIYADLWEDKALDPAAVIVSAVRQAIVSHDGVVLKGAKAAGLTKFKLAGFELDLGAIGTPQGQSLARTLELLSKTARKPIVMVIDEAQHAQSTEAGRHMLFALKAARDALLLGKDTFGLRLLATGSNSDKLAAMVNAKDQAFYLAPLESLDVLGRDYLQWLVRLAGESSRITPSLAALEQGFAACGHRPEPLRAVLRRLAKEALLGHQHEGPAIDARFLALVGQTLQADREAFLQSLASLDALDAAVLRRMARMGKGFAAFNEAAIAAYRALVAEWAPGEDTAVTKSAVQLALERLRKTGLVWNLGRGAWQIEDSQHVAWLLGEGTPGEAQPKPPG